MKVATVVGARPQFIKAASVSRALEERQGATEVIIHTGQHYDPSMSRVFFRELGIPEPSHHLDIGSGSHGAQTGRMLEAIEAVLVSEAPDLLLVYGDTNSTIAGALAAAKLHIPVAHVEAGLRSFNRSMPEEVNRILTDHASDLLFAPTEAAVRHLEHEGIETSGIHLVGDVMYDAALHYARRAGDDSRILGDLRLEPASYVLATIHRAENTDVRTRLTAIFGGLARVAAEMPVVVPLHPRTRRALAQTRIDTSHLTVTEPLGYLDMIELERNARLIATDSGGVQKEAYFHRVPCVTLRDETEWVELVEHGWNTLAPPTDAAAVSGAILRRLNVRGREIGLYGNGTAARAIVDILLATVLWR